MRGWEGNFTPALWPDPLLLEATPTPICRPAPMDLGRKGQGLGMGGGGVSVDRKRTCTLKSCPEKQLSRCKLELSYSET